MREVYNRWPKPPSPPPLITKKMGVFGEKETKESIEETRQWTEYMKSYSKEMDKIPTSLVIACTNFLGTVDSFGGTFFPKEINKDIEAIRRCLQ